MVKISNDSKTMLKILGFMIPLIVAFLLATEKNQDVTDYETLYFENRTTNGVIYMDSEFNSYFVDYWTLENSDVESIEYDNINVALNKHGEILQVSKK